MEVAAEVDVMCNRPFSNAQKADRTRLNLPGEPLIQNRTHLWSVSVGLSTRNEEGNECLRAFSAK